MLDVCHKVVMSPDIKREWTKHRSLYSLCWLATMQSRRKVVNAAVDYDRQDALVATIVGSELGTAQRAETEKDCLLVSAAWASDGLVASNDGKIRKYLSESAATYRDLARIVWVNPTDPTDEAIAWLTAGARTEPGRRLGTSRTKP